MKTVRLFAPSSSPMLQGFASELRWRFAESDRYELLDLPADSLEQADVTLAVMDDPMVASRLPIVRRSYQDFIGLIYIGEPGSGEGAKVVRAYEAGLTVMANLAIDVEGTGDDSNELLLTLVTPERGIETVVGTKRVAAEGEPDSDSSCGPTAELLDELFLTLVRRSDVTYIDDNVISTDLAADLCAGTAVTASIQDVARRLDGLDLVPPAVPLDGLSERARRRYFKVLGLRQISYGNMSAREPGRTGFWMTGRGVDKAALDVIGRDLVYIDRFDRDERAVYLRVPSGYDEARSSIDTSIHAVIYDAYPKIGSMIHIHAELDDIVYTDNHYPCGTVELCDSIVDGLSRTEDPDRTILGLTNHGLLITGADTEDAWSLVYARHAAMAPAGVA